jgi:predicted regulator of Ras-like GTPase activity (Roadblock/LC7/MglB family)
MALDPPAARQGMQQELKALVAKLPTAKLAAVVSEDGLLAATHLDAEPNAVDRRGAVLASLTALARTAANEHGLEEARWLVLSCRLGVMVVRPFGRKRRRLLLVVVGAAEKLANALGVAKEFALRIDAKYGSDTKVEPAAEAAEPA